MTAHVNIGSNKGDRMAVIGRAVALISSSPLIAAAGSVCCSAPFESEPWGFQSSQRFLNVGVNFETSLPPLPLLEALAGIQSSIDSAPHRDTLGRYIDRVIDIDLIALDDIILDSPRLTLPHPRMHMREFVLTPMAELWPGWIHPRLHKSPSELLSILNAAGSAR